MPFDAAHLGHRHASADGVLDRHRPLIGDLRLQEDRRRPVAERSGDRIGVRQHREPQILEPAHIDDIADDAGEVDVIGADRQRERDDAGMAHGNALLAMHRPRL